MKQKTTILLFSLAFITIGCSDSKTQNTEQVQATKTIKTTQKTPIKSKKVYAIDEIYNTMCVECHSPDGSGNVEKLTPSMADLSQQEMEEALLEVENDDGHVIMEHNREQILKMDMEYSAKDMSKYMFKKFKK